MERTPLSYIHIDYLKGLHSRLSISAPCIEPGKKRASAEYMAKVITNECSASDLRRELEDLGFENRYIDSILETEALEAQSTRSEQAAVRGSSRSKTKVPKRAIEFLDEHELLACLAHADELVRADACKELGKRQICLNEIECACSDDKAGVRAAAIQALSNWQGLPDRVLNIALRLLRDKKPSVVQASLDLYIGFRHLRDEDEILELTRNKNRVIRQKAYHALGAIRTTKYREVLVDGLGEADHRVRTRAARAIRLLEDPDLLLDINRHIASGVEKPNRGLGDILVIKELVQAAEKCDGPSRDEELLLRVLRGLVGARSVAAQTLGRLGVEKARADLENATFEASKRLRKAAISAIINIGPEKSCVRLREMLKDKDHDVIATACRALAVAKDLEAVPKLEELVYHSSPGIRNSAFYAVVDIAPHRGRQLAEAFSGDDDPKTKELALKYFGQHHQVREDPPYVPTDFDERLFRVVTVADRVSQQDFRQKLFDVHGVRCLVSGQSVLDTIQAAHIVPFRSENDNNSHNGLLLRADIHLLFDCHLIAIEPGELVVRVSPTLGDTEYFEWDGAELKTKYPDYVSREALEYCWGKYQERLAKSL